MTELHSDDRLHLAVFKGKSDISCAEHDYKKFPGLSEDLTTYAENWKGDGWDDIKVNVDHAKGTKISVDKPIMQPYDTPQDTTVILASDIVRNDSSEPSEVTVELKGTFENSITAKVEEEMTTELGAEIAGSIQIFSGSLSMSVSATARKGWQETAAYSVEFKRTVTLTVPPKKAFEVKMEALVEKRKATVTLPCRISGPFRIQYPSRKDGHYYWISHISAAAKNGHQKSNMVTTIEEGTAIKVETIVSDAE